MDRTPPILVRVEKLEKSVILLKLVTKYLMVVAVLAATYLITK
jgi:hypothetical protein